MRNLLILAPLLALSGCGLFGDGIAACNERQPYQGSTELPALAAPEGVDAPNTRNALKIPEVRATPRPRTGAGCLDEPPEYYAKPATPAPAPTPPAPPST